MRSLVGTFLFAVSAAATFATGAPVPKHLMKVAPAGLNDRWELASHRFGDKPLPVEGRTVLELAPGALVLTTNAGEATEARIRGVLAHDAQVRRLSVTARRDSQGRPVNPDVAYGYVLDGDKLLLATRFGAANGELTAGDPGAPGANDYTMVLTRAKK